MALDLHSSAITKIANWGGVARTPDITFEYDAQSGHTHVTADVMSLGQSGGQRDTEGIVVFGGKRINQEKPQEDFEIKFDVKLTTTLYDAIMMDTTYAVGTEIKNTTTKTRWRITITWQDPLAVTQTAAEKLRWIYKDVTCVSWEPEMDADSYLKGTITFKVPAFDSNGNSNLIKEYETSSNFTTMGATHGGAEDAYAYAG